MYDTFAEFDAGLKQAWPELQSASPDKIKGYYMWYTLARAQDKIVIGRQEHLEQVKRRYGVAAQGGAMLIDVKGWDIITNDSWILGGIHALNPFYLRTVLTFAASDTAGTSPVYNDKEKDNPDPTRIMFATSREVSALNLFGYIMKDPNSPDGMKFECMEMGLARNANFKTYRTHTVTIGNAARS